MKMASWLAATWVLCSMAASADTATGQPRMKLGAYYFAGWAGKSSYDRQQRDRYLVKKHIAGGEAAVVHWQANRAGF